MFGVASEDLWRLIQQRGRRNGHLKARVHMIHGESSIAVEAGHRAIACDGDAKLGGCRR